MNDKGALNAQPYVVVAPDGLYYVGIHENEHNCWQIAFGWPDESEISEHKSKGWYCANATLTWKKPHE